MVTLYLSYVYLSLYGAINIAIGLKVFYSAAYNPYAFHNHFFDLAIGFVAFLIGIVCFVSLSIRADYTRSGMHIRRKLGCVLLYGLLPLLVACLVMNLIDHHSIELLIASILSVIAATVTFILVWRRLRSVPFSRKNK